jgi:hypothetical protein
VVSQDSSGQILRRIERQPDGGFSPRGSKQGVTANQVNGMRCIKEKKTSAVSENGHAQLHHNLHAASC